MPIGTIVWFAASSPPDGWLECNGQSTTAYPALAAVVGSTVPDLRGRFVRGWNHDSNIDSLRIFGSTQNSQSNTLEKVKFSWGSASDWEVNVPVNGAYSNMIWSGNAAPYSNINLQFALSGLETRPDNIALLPVIKATP